MTEGEDARFASHVDELAAPVIEAERRPSSGLNLAVRKGSVYKKSPAWEILDV